MTLRLDLLRHGETELGGGLRGSLDDALTELGWAQMHEAVQGQGPWDRIVSSPLQRCRLFAQALAATLEVPLTLDADLQELHFGVWEGQSAAALILAMICRLHIRFVMGVSWWRTLRITRVSSACACTPSRISRLKVWMSACR